MRINEYFSYCFIQDQFALIFFLLFVSDKPDEFNNNLDGIITKLVKIIDYLDRFSTKPVKLINKPNEFSDYLVSFSD